MLQVAALYDRKDKGAIMNIKDEYGAKKNAAIN